MINFFIHPKLRDPQNKDFLKAKIFAYLVLVLLISLIPYCIYFAIVYPDDSIKNWNNVVCVSLFAISASMIRFTSNFKIPLSYTAGLSFIPIMISVYHTGGVYSVDLAWVFVCIISQAVLIDYRWGIFSSLAVCVYITFLYISENQLNTEANFFKNHVIEHNNTHYYFTWIFVILLMAALVGTFAKVFENTNKKLENLTKEKIDDLEIRVKQKTDEISQLRSTLARDFHDEMGNKLASINILSQSVAFTLKDKEQNPEALKLLETIELRSKELFDGTKDFIWSIDYKSDYIFELFVYLRDFGEHFFNGMDISFYSETNAKESSLFKIKSTTGRQLILVCKEIMTNAARHSGCNEMIFEVSVTGKTALIFLKDNGKGFDTEKVSKRGLLNIQNRLKQIEAKHSISSSQKGTSFSIEVLIENY